MPQIITRSVAEDQGVLLYVKCIADVGLTAGSAADQATVAVAGDVITFQIAADGGALANDTGIDYTGAAGADGTITITDANANSVREIRNIINGQGTGQTAFRRWRAAYGDFRPGIATTAGDLLARAATNALVGENDDGVRLLVDQSAGPLTADTMHVALGGFVARKGSGPVWPDYFEDIPGSSTVAGVNTPIRSGRKVEEEFLAQRRVKLTGFTAGMAFATTKRLRIYDIGDNLLYEENLAITAGVFQDRSDIPIIGPPGSPLFIEVDGTGAYTAGALSVVGEIGVF